MNIKEKNDTELKTMRKNLKFLRTSRNWSIEKLSEVSGIHKKILAGMESDEDFGIEHLIQLCRIYKIKPHEIFSPVN